MRRSGWIRAAALAGCAMLVLAGCAADITPRVAAPGPPERTECGTLTLANLPWVGYEANLAVVGYLAENRLDCTVVVKDLTAEEAWAQVAAGEVDAILENWGREALKKRYIDEERTAVEHGMTGNKGVVGWYVTPWLVEQYPGITNWKNLNDYAYLFRTPTSDGKGALLGGDPSYETNDRALIRNLKLNFTVSLTGSEEKLIEAFREAERNRQAAIGYFYAPQWFLAEVNLVHVKLPPYTPGCDSDPEKVACDYQPYDLDKIANRTFAESGNPAAEMIKNFQWTNADQNEVARYLTVDKLSRDEAAKKWLDANPDVWQDWLPVA
ncbi:glycine/betaine ABC transporter substrate-binding protein [Micromonospora zingiberis]|uniref:Glycine/betaine ABC transporter substrate-binding protein n=1 Tax=Micromonospora zingiberis TaxID=2053011 RepID=A0A4R0GLN5_9ACTN|nr:ABC transporter substrate-binding protein [Micromonospora zingiberis]TCB98574.1 glycine/betaine ABC transporter substrate-binding protein [Micromonospora zingiberis]